MLAFQLLPNECSNDHCGRDPFVETFSQKRERDSVERVESCNRWMRERKQVVVCERVKEKGRERESAMEHNER